MIWSTGTSAVERADEVVAVPPRIRNLGIALAAVGLGKTNEVHPVARPAFAEARAREQAIGCVRDGPLMLRR